MKTSGTNFFFLSVFFFFFFLIYIFQVTVHRYKAARKNPTDLQTENFHFTVEETQRWGVNLPKVYTAGE